MKRNLDRMCYTHTDNDTSFCQVILYEQKKIEVKKKSIGIDSSHA